jgi:hypothetical protein
MKKNSLVLEAEIVVRRLDAYYLELQAFMEPENPEPLVQWLRQKELLGEAILASLEVTGANLLEFSSFDEVFEDLEEGENQFGEEF